MSSNGHSSSRTDAIDRLLKGRSSDAKANVLEYMVKYNIDPENEFFIIFVALGELETLIESSPKEWQDLFKNFQETLKEWASTNLETLNQLANEAKTVERLAVSSESLNNSFTKFLEICTEPIYQLQKSNGQLANSLSHLQTSEMELKNLVKETKSELSQLEKQLSNLNSTPKANQQKKTEWIWKDSILVGAIALSLLTSGFLFWNQAQVAQGMSQRVQWLLEKANRQDCLSGIKAPDSPECRGINSNK